VLVLVLVLDDRSPGADVIGMLGPRHSGLLMQLVVRVLEIPRG